MKNYFVQLQWSPDVSNLEGKRELVRKIGEFEKLGVKLQCSTEEGKQLLVRVIGRFEKMRVREIGIPPNHGKPNGLTSIRQHDEQDGTVTAQNDLSGAKQFLR